MPSITFIVTTKNETVESGVHEISDAIPLAEVSALYAQMARSNGMIEAPEFEMDEDDPLGLRRGENN